MQVTLRPSEYLHVIFFPQEGARVLDLCHICFLSGHLQAKVIIMSSDDLGKRNQGDRPVWENPDPRVRWALDLFDDKGFEPRGYLSQFFWPALGGITWGMAPLAANLISRRPYYAGAVWMVGLGVMGTGIGYYTREFLAKRAADREMAAMHYIMLHPDRFPEPQAKKFGEKEVFLPWPVAR